MARCCSPVSTQDSRSLQDLPRRLKMHPRRFKTPPRRPKTHQDAPTWLSKRSQHQPKTKLTSITNLMFLGMAFWNEFDGFFGAKWSLASTEMCSKIDFDFERRFLKNHALAATGARFLKFQLPKLEHLNK